MPRITAPEMAIPEAAVLDAVLDCLQAHRVLAFRMNTGAMKLENRFVKFGVPGFADVLAVVTVRGYMHGLPCAWVTCWFLEIKSAGGRQTPEQRSFEKQVAAAGAEYFVVRSSEQMEAILRQHGVIK